jgi:NADH-quinone oxidoreductase subunit L
VGGFVGIPELFGTNYIHHFLNEVFVSPAQLHLEHGASVAHAAHGHATLEISLMVVSVLVALAGILTAHHFYHRNPEVPARLKKRFAGLHKLVYNKYYIDELYEKVVITPLRGLCNLFYNIGDRLLVEGVVNGSAHLVNGIGSVVRLLQSGSVRHYLLGMMAGAVVMIILVVYL